MTRIPLLVVTAVLLAAFAVPAAAQQPTHEVKMKDGTLIRGVVMVQMDDVIMIQTADGVQKISTDKIEKVSKVTAPVPQAQPQPLPAKTSPPPTASGQAPATIPPLQPVPVALEPLSPLCVLDTLTLTDGTVVKGKVTMNTTDLVMLRTPDGALRKYPRSDIKDLRIISTEELRKDYDTRNSALTAGDPPGNIELALWCYANRLSQEGQEQLNAALKSDDRADLLKAIKIAIGQNDLSFAGSAASRASARFPDHESFKRIETAASSLFDLAREKQQLTTSRIFAARTADKARKDVEKLQEKVARPYTIYYKNVEQVVPCDKCGGDGRQDKKPAGSSAITVKGADKSKKKNELPGYPCTKCNGGRKKKYKTVRVEKKKPIDVTKEKERLAELQPKLKEAEAKLRETDARLKEIDSSIDGHNKTLAAEVESAAP